jgi:Asp-tRNA(Asn)/Glu-tRNA(Gln) amidotransferase A subunit family amidase
MHAKFPALLSAMLLSAGAQAAEKFTLQEATIADVHAAIQSGQITCKGLVEAYIKRARAYNGVCTALVTPDGKSVSAATGKIYAGVPTKFPTQTVAVSQVLPDIDQYQGPPIEYGRMEKTLSDPSVQQQFGLRVGVAHAGQLNALETLNIRGERSVTCKGKFDAHPSTGPLPKGAPAACEKFRQQPDALETAAALDKQYGTKPDLAKLPMYCVVMSLKNWYDAKDMRGTGGNDVNFAMDVPKEDSPDIANLRDKGAIIYAIATARATGLSADGPEKEKSYLPSGNFADAAWTGQACNPFDTSRVPRGTSNGSGVSVSANLAMCSICEQTVASCKGPASRNGIVNLLATKGVTQDGGPGYQHIGDRAGIHCRTVGDAAKVLDSIKGFESRDMYTALPKGIIPKEPYASFLVGGAAAGGKPLQGVRVGVVREFMVKHVKNDAAISDQIDREIKTALRDKLGAELVESTDPMYPDDPDVPNMKYTFEDAFKEILANNIPEYFWQTDKDGKLKFAVPGWDVRTVDYAVALAMGKAPLSKKINLRTVADNLDVQLSPFAWNKYLAERGDERVKTWADWVANSKFGSENDRVGAQNAVGVQDLRPKPDEISYLKMRMVMQLVILKVMQENKIDVFVNPENTLPPFKLGGPTEPTVNSRATGSCCGRFTAIIGAPEIDLPAGWVETVYEPQYVLSKDKTRYESVTGTVASKLPVPMPISMTVWAGPGSDPDVIKVASAYEAVTHHRKPPPEFGPVPGEPQ